MSGVSTSNISHHQLHKYIPGINIYICQALQLMMIYIKNRNAWHSYIFIPLTSASCSWWWLKPSCIDLILTNKPRSFQCSSVIETGLSDFHKMTVNVMKTFFEKLQPRVVNYRDYKYFENDKFSTNLLSEFGKANTKEKESGLNDLLDACKRILDIHAPCKQKYAKGNHMPSMNKALSKEIMTRTRLRNKFWKDRSEKNNNKYSKQRNYCVSLLRNLNRTISEILMRKISLITKIFGKLLKVVLATFLLVCFLSLNESTCRTRKNVFISLQKLYSFRRNSNFRILNFQISWRHQMLNSFMTEAVII